MNINTDEPFETTVPVFIKEADTLRNRLKELDYGELKKLWKCSDKIAEENFLKLKELDLYSNVTPAVLSYEGIHQYMALSGIFCRAVGLCERAPEDPVRALRGAETHGRV